MDPTCPSQWRCHQQDTGADCKRGVHRRRRKTPACWLLCRAGSSSAPGCQFRTSDCMHSTPSRRCTGTCSGPRCSSPSPASAERCDHRTVPVWSRHVRVSACPRHTKHCSCPTKTRHQQCRRLGSTQYCRRASPRYAGNSSHRTVAERQSACGAACRYRTTRSMRSTAWFARRKLQIHSLRDIGACCKDGCPCRGRMARRPQ